MAPSSTQPSAPALPAWQINYGKLPAPIDPLTPQPWSRPADWLPLPAINPGEQKLVGLFAVFPGEGNVLALRAAGNYCVDWGDGTSEQISSPGEVIQRQTQWFANNFYGPLERMSLANPADVQWQQRIEGTLVVFQNGALLDPSAYTVGVNPSTNNVELVLATPVPDGVFANIQARWEWGETVVAPVTAEHRYDHDSIPAATACSRGYRQVIVTVTPQSGSDLTLLDLSPRHNSISQDDASCPWLELAISLPKAADGASLALCGYERSGTYDYLGSVEKIVIHDAGGATNFRWLLYYFGALRVFALHKASALEAIDGLFGNCSSLDQIELPALPALTSASELLYGATALRELRLQGLSSLTSLEGSFQYATALEQVWIEEAALLTSTASTFMGCTSLRELQLSGAPQLSDLSHMFSGCTALITAPSFDTSAATTMTATFEGCTALREVPHYDTRRVNTMESLFSGCQALASIPALDTSAVRDMRWMFSGCWALTPVPQLDTRLVETMEGMFSSCYALATIPRLATDSVVSMTSTFSGCYALLNLPPLAVQSVREFWSCFSSCVSLAAAPLEGISASISFWGCALSRQAIVAIFQRLASVSDNPSIEIGGNWGTSGLTPDDLAIATAKGWTVLY